jgi:hypothetical protein
VALVDSGIHSNGEQYFKHRRHLVDHTELRGFDRPEWKLHGSHDRYGAYVPSDRHRDVASRLDENGKWHNNPEIRDCAGTTQFHSDGDGVDINAYVAIYADGELGKRSYPTIDC